MKRESSIVKLSLFSVAIILGFLLAFCSFRLWGYNDFTGFAKTIDKGVDLTGGVSILYEVEEDSDISNFDKAISSTIASLSGILENNGYNPTVEKEGIRKIRVNVPGEQDSSAVLGLLGTAGEVSFVINDNVILTGEHIKQATATAVASGYAVVIQLTSAGTPLFATATGNNANGTLSIKLGDTTVSNITLPAEAITDGQLVITSENFTIESSRLLANQIMAGKYGLKLTVKGVETISESSGKTALKVGVIAGAIGLVLVIALAIFLYGLFGVASSIAVLAFSVLMLFILAVFPWVQLSLPGIVGVLIAISIMAAFNIAICERIKDEYRNGKSILSASHYGFRKSIRAIIDSGIIIALVSIVLIFFGNTAVKGFAITLLIGIMLAVFTSLVLTRMFINYMVRINQTEPKLYKLERGEGYEGINADQNDAVTEMEILERQRRIAERKRKESSPEGGNV